MNCVYLGEKQPRQANGNNDVFHCYLKENCTQQGEPNDVASCQHCKSKLPLKHKWLKNRFQDYLQVFDRNKQPTDCLRNLLNKGTAFLVCGGPSARQLPLEQLNQRGCWSMAVNNVAGWHRFQPQAFVCADPPSKFCDGVWMDPKIMKFVPTPKLTHKPRGHLRHKRNQPGPDGSYFERLKIDDQEMSTVDAPNVWAFERDAWLVPDDSFFLRDSAAWGNHDAGVRRTGEEKTVCTMLCGLRLLYYLGARTIFLVGVDFWMNPAASPNDNYSFGELRDKGACESNNKQFRIVNDWLCRLQKNEVFSRFGLSCYNVNESSGLQAFPYVPFEEAVKFSRRHLPEEPFDLKDWYVKK